MANVEPLLPEDDHNRRLERNVRPRAWDNPTPRGRYHLVVLGAGTAGLVTAAGAAALGAKVAIVERARMGGDCLNVGCVPSKGMISAARRAALVRRAAAFGIELSAPPRIDFAAAMERMRKLRADISPADSAARFRDLGVDVYFGQGRFVDSNTIDVDGRRLTFKKAVIATGARAAAPPIPGLDHCDYLTNESVFSLTELPRRIGVIGAGPVGCEMAQSFAQFGSEVLLVETEHGVLPREDREAANVVQQALERDGVQLLCCGRDLAINNQGALRLTVTSHGRDYDEPLDKLLVAVGRAPNVEELNLEAVGVEYDRKGVRVDDYLRTTNSNIFAAGDICSRYQFTHAADFMARIVVQNALFWRRARFSSLVIPWCTYTLPELAHVGLTETQARDQGVEIVTFVERFDHVDRAILEGETEGFVKVHVRKGTDRIAGATVVAHHAGDLIAEISLALTQRLGLKKIAAAIHPYPTQAEAIRKLGDQFNRTRLTPWAKSILEKWFAWTR